MKSSPIGFPKPVKKLTLKKLLEIKYDMAKYANNDNSTIWVTKEIERILKNKRTKPVKAKVRPLKKEKIKSLPKIKNLEERLKRVMYPYIKKRDGNVCISCGKKGLQGMDWHAGHYIKAELCNMVTRYDEWNINSQCSYCNRWRRGNTIAYRLAMIDKYGEKAVNTLDREYHSPLPMNFNHREWLLDKIKEYAEK